MLHPRALHCTIQHRTEVHCTALHCTVKGIQVTCHKLLRALYWQLLIVSTVFKARHCTIEKRTYVLAQFRTRSLNGRNISKDPSTTINQSKWSNEKIKWWNEIFLKLESVTVCTPAIQWATLHIIIKYHIASLFNLMRVIEDRSW